MNQHHYRKLKEYCEFGDLRFEMGGYHFLRLHMAVDKLNRCIFREFYKLFRRVIK